MNRDHPQARDILLDVYHAAIAAVAPGPVVARALRHAAPAARVWLIALGKAAHPMAHAAVRAIESGGHAPAGGLIVAADAGPSPHPAIGVVVGDHPEPGAGSLAAADALGVLVRQIPAGETVWVLLSGGTTSLVGAPQPGIAPGDLTTLYGQLLRSGLDIAAMNRVRKRFTRWSGGRLARSLGHAGAVDCYIVSDVVGDDLAAIGSGPCVADPSTAREVHQSLAQADLWSTLPASVRDHLSQVETGALPETPKPGEPAIERVRNLVIASNRLALDAAAARARERGLLPQIVGVPMVGDASTAGDRIARQLVAAADPQAVEPTRCIILGGETTVTLGEHAGRGGRCQELALAAARALNGAPSTVALLAAGTDGRDGPTDAAGAVVDGTTWSAIAAAGRDPHEDLSEHHSYDALASAAALIKTGPTGTNVMDLVIGLT
jgi:glycerate 2-kinase